MQNTITHSQTVSSTSQFQNVIMEFAKTNKVSRAKVEAYTAAIIASLPKAKESTGKTGRPMLEKTQALYNQIVKTIERAKEIESGDIPNIGELNLRADAASIRKYLGEDTATFNNAISALIRHGKIQHVGKAKTGSRGRQPFILSVNKSE